MESGAITALHNWLVYQEARSGIREIKGYLFPKSITATWDKDCGFQHTFVPGGPQVSILSIYVPDYPCLWIMRQQGYRL